MRCFLLASSIVLAIAGCAADGGSHVVGTGGDGGTGSGDGSTGGRDGSVGPRDGAGSDGFSMCGGDVFTGDNLTAPVDIIWVVDSSDSMENDASTVQSNLDGFATYIESMSIDFHVVLISDRGFVTPSARFSSDPRFLFVDRSVGSNDAFDRVLDQFPMYMAHLRPTATTHVIGVTDDDENMGASTFISMMNTLLGHDFTYHAIASPPGECNSLCPFGCSACPPDAEGCGRSGDFLPAAAPGEEHWAAAAATGGMTFSICTNDWSGLFDTLAMTVAVAEELPCVYEIPDPPMGMSFDRDLVNVDHTPSGGSATRFPRVNDAAACGSTAAWHYDDAAMPSAIVLCPAACTAVTAGPGMLSVELGCATLLI
jgi:hypothetical protein